MTDRQLALVCDEADTLCALWIVQHQKPARLSAITATGRALGMHCDSRAVAARALQRLQRKGAVDCRGQVWRVADDQTARDLHRLVNRMQDTLERALLTDDPGAMRDAIMEVLGR